MEPLYHTMRHTLRDKFIETFMDSHYLICCVSRANLKNNLSDQLGTLDYAIEQDIYNLEY